MKLQDLTPNTFKAIAHELGHDRDKDERQLWQRRLSADSVFCRSLVSCGYLTEEQMQRAALRYRLGKSRSGAVIFWQIDDHDDLHDGKLMYYRPDCHRDHDRHPTWVSYLLRQSGQLPWEWQSEHCLFGLHLLREKVIVKSEEFATARTIAVVESEKTAVIMSEVRPDCLWLATGGKTELNVARLKPLAGCRIILFPDTDTDGSTYQLWFDVAQAASELFGHPVTVSTLLEQMATVVQKQKKIDIVDLLFSQRMNDLETN